MAQIGVFDSGIGGLSILNEALRQLPEHHYVYFADSANAPYGERSAEWIAQRSLKICQHLATIGCDAIVVACNTATAEAIRKIREALPNIPIIGVEPGIKPAAMQSQNGIVGVLATEATLSSDKFNALLATLPQHCRFVKQAGAGLVPLIEAGKTHTIETQQLLASHLKPIQEAGADTLVLGCTHYPFLNPLIETILGKQIKVIDTSEAVVRQLGRQIQEKALVDSKTPYQLLLKSSLDGKKLHNRVDQLINPSPVDHQIRSETLTL